VQAGPERVPHPPFDGSVYHVIHRKNNSRAADGCSPVIANAIPAHLCVRRKKGKGEKGQSRPRMEPLFVAFLLPGTLLGALAALRRPLRDFGKNRVRPPGSCQGPLGPSRLDRPGIFRQGAKAQRRKGRSREELEWDAVFSWVASVSSCSPSLYGVADTGMQVGPAVAQGEKEEVQQRQDTTAAGDIPEIGHRLTYHAMCDGGQPVSRNGGVDPGQEVRQPFSQALLVHLECSCPIQLRHALECLGPGHPDGRHPKTGQKGQRVEGDHPFDISKSLVAQDGVVGPNRPAILGRHNLATSSRATAGQRP